MRAKDRFSQAHQAPEEVHLVQHTVLKGSRGRNLNTAPADPSQLLQLPPNRRRLVYDQLRSVGHKPSSAKSPSAPPHPATEQLTVSFVGKAGETDISFPKDSCVCV